MRAFKIQVRGAGFRGGDCSSNPAEIIKWNATQIAGGESRSERGLKKMKPPLITKCQRRISAVLRYQFLVARAAESENRPKCARLGNNYIVGRCDSRRDRQVECVALSVSASAFCCRAYVACPASHTASMENFHGKRVHSPGWWDRRRPASSLRQRFYFWFHQMRPKEGWIWISGFKNC
jgi:hypothetical protein